MSRDFLVKTIFGTLMNTFWFAVLPVLQLVPDDRMLSALFGGVLMGAGSASSSSETVRRAERI